MNKQDTVQTAVVFRRWRSGTKSILALFPREDAGQGCCQSYEHIGQHCGANYWLCVKNTRPAGIEEADVKELHAELTAIGYNLKVIKRARR